MAWGLGTKKTSQIYYNGNSNKFPLLLVFRQFFSPCPLLPCPVKVIVFFSFPFLFPVFVSLFRFFSPWLVAALQQVFAGCKPFVTKIHLQEVYMSYSILKPALMAIHRRLVKKGLYFEAANVMAYLRGIRTIYTKACVRFWLANHRSIGW